MHELEGPIGSQLWTSARHTLGRHMPTKDVFHPTGLRLSTLVPFVSPSGPLYTRKNSPIKRSQFATAAARLPLLLALAADVGEAAQSTTPSSCPPGLRVLYDEYAY